MRRAVGTLVTYPDETIPTTETLWISLNRRALNA